jgi:hypothetical protein
VVAVNDLDFISLTDMIRAKDGDFFIADWLRNRNTVEFLGIWESVFNPNFNYGEFAIIKSQVGLNSYNLESLNSVLIRQGLSQHERLNKLNEIAISQMRTLLADSGLKKLKG